MQGYLYIGRNQALPTSVAGNGGDVVTATNMTGAAVSKDDKVWLEKSGANYNIVNFETMSRDFTVYGSPNISDSTKVFSIPYPNTYNTNYIETPSAFSGTVTSFEMVFKFKIPNKLSVDTSNTNYIFRAPSEQGAPHLTFGTWYGLDGGTTYPYPFGLGMTVNNTTIGILSWNSIVEEQWYWVKYSYSNGTISFSYSTDGTNYVTTGMYQSSESMSVNLNQLLTFGRFGLGSAVDVDLGATYLNVNGILFWKPYQSTINITSDTVTGIAKENIANNASGSVKTVLS